MHDPLNQTGGHGQRITLQSLIDTHEQPFMVIDRDGCVVAVSRSWEQAFGFAQQDILGASCGSVFYGDDQDAAAEQASYHDAAFRRLQPYTRITTHLDAHGQSYNVRVRGYPLSDADGGLYVGEAILPLDMNDSLPRCPDMIGHSPAFESMREHLLRAAASEAPVLLEGETGTGKELAARFVHDHSTRATAPFVVVDCTILSADLFESELFGHEKGAFTGSTGVKKGLFELADGGTLFIDELGELPLSMQSKLLRALESGTFKRVGGTRILQSSVRVVSATNRSLADMVAQGSFRSDLFYRLAVYPVSLPPLRARREDIPQLADALLFRIGSQLGRQYDISEPALVRLASHDYPGNVREMRNVLQLAAACTDGDVIEPEAIRFISQSQNFVDQVEATVDSGSESEAAVVERLLREHDGRRSAVAQEMGVSERTLYRKLRRYGLSQGRR